MPSSFPAARAAALPDALEVLRRSAKIWRAGDELARTAAVSTGWAALDSQLPGGGWPLGALTEIAPRCLGIGELSLMLPAIQTLCAQHRIVCFVQPPCTPYAPALARCQLPLGQIVWIKTDEDRNARWAAEELLRAGAGAVLLWSSTHDDRALRRLQLAAEAGRSIVWLFRAAASLRQASPAALRLALTPAPDSLDVEIIKVRGGHAARTRLPLPWTAL